jgi:hypothetical protein
LSIDTFSRRISIRNANIAQNTAYPSLKKLDLRGRINNAVINYINISLPNFFQLSWQDTTRIVPPRDFMLPNHNFHVLNINHPPHPRYLDDDSPTVIYNFHWHNAEDESIRLKQFESVFFFVTRRSLNVAPEINGQPLIINITCTSIRHLYCGEIVIF